MKEKQRMYLKPEAILKYLSGDDTLHTLIATRNTEYELLTTDQDLYEAMGSVKSRQEIDINYLVKLLEVVTIMPFEELNKKPRTVLTEERVEELRKLI